MSNRVTQGSQFNFSLALGWKDILVSPVDDICGLIDVGVKVKNKDMGSIRLHPLVFGISAVTGMRALTIGNF